VDARIGRNIALGMTAILALAALLALLSATGLARTAWAANLDVCSSGCPYTIIQDAINAAANGDTIRVAAGTYTGSMTCDISGLGTYTSTLCITEDITLLGGYNPADFTVRDPDVYRTTVRWEGEPGHIIVILANGTAAVVDGFEITGATGEFGTAIWVRDSAPRISHNSIFDNHSLGWRGAGIFVSGYSNAAVEIESNEILSNTAGVSGGGIFLSNGATAVISDNLIAYNQAITDAGGLHVRGTSVVTVTNNQILSNTALNNGGGGFLAEENSSFLLSDNTFQGNSAGCCGGGMAAWWNTTGTVAENTFKGNIALNWGGGGVYLAGGPFDLVNNDIVENHADADLGGGVAVAGEDGHATLVGNLVMSNTASAGGGGISIDYGPKVVLQSNRILSNVSHDWLGSGLRIVTANVLVDRNLIAYNMNDVYDWGNGAIGIDMDDSLTPVTITNNVIVDNVDKGVAVYGTPSSLTIVNNTIANNRNEGVMVWESVLVEMVRNNIVASNDWCGLAVATGSQIQTVDYNDVWNNGESGEEDYCDYGGGAPVPGPGSISADPQFVDAAAGDYHLAWGSPAMNAGTNAGAPAYDKDGVPRPQLSRVDMGAYEQVGFEIFLPMVLRNAGQPVPREWAIEAVDPNGDGIPSMVLGQDQHPHMAYSCSGGPGPLCYAVKSGTQWTIEWVDADSGEVSLALDAADHPHISSGNGDLSYSYFDGSSWTVQTVEPFVGSGMGRNSALALDGSGRPHIVYYGLWTSGPTDLWHAFYDGNQWVKEVVASDAWGDGRGFSSGLLADSSGDLHAIYTSGASGPYDVSYAHYNGSTWSTQVIASGSAGSIAMASDGSLHASFVSGNHVRHAKLVGSNWVIQDVAPWGTPYASASPQGWVLDGATSIQLDSQDRPHIAFYNQLDWYSGQLCYARWDGSQWQLEVVDTQGQPGFGDLSLALDSSDKAHIAYFDIANSELRYAYLE
jgi:parallel beta-helix repeat protein